MIGCDIINLPRYQNKGGWHQNKRLLRYLAVPEPFQLKIHQQFGENGYWVIWSIIEAAYKCVNKTEKQRFNRPGRFCWNTLKVKNSNVFATLTYKATTLNVKLCCSNNENIQAIAMPAKENYALRKINSICNTDGILSDSQLKNWLWHVVKKNLGETIVVDTNNYTFAKNHQTFTYCLSHSFGLGLMVFVQD